MKKLTVALTALAMVSSVALAEDITVDTPYWNALDADEQAEIVDILRATKLIDPTDELVSNPAESTEAVASMEEFKLRWPKIKIKIPIPGLCQIACDAAAVTAAVACAGSAVAVAACLVAVEAGRQVCRRKC